MRIRDMEGGVKREGERGMGGGMARMGRVGGCGWNGKETGYRELEIRSLVAAEATT